MNKQKGDGRIEWTDYTHNPIAGCMHGCAWQMPDGNLANCYAEDVANKVAMAAYPKGFEHHYFYSTRLNDPAKVKQPSKIFVGSMADVFGHWVPEDEINQVLDACRRSPQHQFQFLTKNPVRLKQFNFPENCWVGISAPPTQMNGSELTRRQQDRWFGMSLMHLQKCNAQVKWVSFEPLSYNIAPILDAGLADIKWAVIGAASNGKTKHQPDPAWVSNLIERLERIGTAIFFKGNLRGNEAAKVWREEFPRTPVHTIVL